MKRSGKRLGMVAVTLAVAACAPVDDSIGSHLAQPPAGAPPQAVAEAGDIAIVGQEVSNAILALPVVANATIPPLVQFTGVTSIVDQPIDTEPYTELLRDRLLLLTRLKLRFVEHTLPPYIPPSKRKKKAEPQPDQNTENPDYEILAELRGHASADYYKIQVEFVDIHTNEVLFNGLYRIRPEASMDSAPPPGPEQAPPPPSGDQPPPAQSPAPPQPSGGADAPTTRDPAGGGNQTL